MAVTYETNARNAKADALVDLLDGGELQLHTAGDVEVATLLFGTPAFGAAASGVATANPITSDSSATGGTATKGKFYTSVAALVMTCTVGTSGTDIVLDNNVISAGVSVAITSLTYTQPAS